MTHGKLTFDKDNLPQLENLADLKRFLAVEGATVILKSHTYLDKVENKNESQKSMYNSRTVKDLRTKEVQLSNGSWFTLGPAKNFKFDGSNRFTVTDPRPEGIDDIVRVYEVSVAG